MKDYIFDIWTLQEIFNTLPEICWHEYHKGEIKEVRNSVYEKEWKEQTTYRSLPHEAWKYVYSKRTGHLIVANDFFPFTRCYIGVMHPEGFLDMIKDALGVSQLHSTETGRVRSFKPVYMLSFLADQQGTCIYGTVSPAKKETSEKSGQEDHNLPETDLEFLCVSVHPIWRYLSVILRNNHSLKSFPKLKEIMKDLQELKQRFVEKFVTFEGYLYDHWIVDGSFLLHYADEFSPELLVNFRRNQRFQGKEPALKIHVAEKTIQDLEKIVAENGENSPIGSKARNALAILDEFRKAYPEDYYSGQFSDPLSIAQHLNKKGIKPLILSFDFAVLGNASEEGIVAGHSPPARFTIVAEGAVELTREKAGEILKWFLEFAGLDHLKKYMKNRGKRLVCDPIVVPKEDVLRFIKDEFESDLPSFFLEAIEETRNKYEKSSLPPLLKDYLEGNQDRKPLDSSLHFLLSPERLPKGSWPAKKGIHPFFNQYLAVVAANYHLLEKEEPKIVSVNGPPGTGKTTLLKEIVANTVVKMASVIAGGIKFPRRKPDKETDLSGDYYEGFEVFTKLGIVVASANNNAVKNVTKELPLAEKNVIDESNPLVREILIEDRDTRRIWERFRSIATVCLREVKKKDGYESSPDRKNLTEEKGLTEGDLTCALNISAVLGKKKYSDAFLETLRRQLIAFQRDKTFADLRTEGYKKAKAALEKAKKEFRQALIRFEEIREDLRLLNENEGIYKHLRFFIKRDDTEEIRKELEQIRNKLRNMENELANARRYLEENEKPSLVKKAWSVFSKDIAEKIEKYEEMERKSAELPGRIMELEKEVEDLEEKLRLISSIEKYRDYDSVILVSGMLGFPDSERQKLKPYGVEEIRLARERVFLTAYKVLIWTAFCHLRKVKTNIELLCKLRWSGTRSRNGDGKKIAQIAGTLWGSFFLLFPVVSTTFHSFQTLFSSLWENRNSLPLGTIVVDEAGQGMPYMALAAFLLGRRAIVVGDPLQLEPVVPIPEEIFNVILKKYGLEEEDYIHISGLNKAVNAGRTNLDSSVQVLADRASIYWGIIPGEDVKLKVGIPLRVHFRCDARIMEVANQVAYGDSMLHFREDPDPGKLVWIDVKTPRGRWKDGHFSLEEKEAVLCLLEELSTAWPPEKIFIISPFRAVPKKLKEEARLNGGIIKELVFRGNVGTIHTFQGKESEVVILMLGGRTPGARRWAAEKPNLLNVAVTRAKKELYVIGDIEAWEKLNYFDVLANSCTCRTHLFF